MSDNFKIYSVESRKGGVGKTTLALTLAKHLLSKGPVLLLDCDITGTSIAPPACNSEFWSKISNVLKDKDGETINLLKHFLSNYLSGKSDMRSIVNKDNVQEKKANIIGSSIYDGTDKSIADARLLMDEIHSYWLVEYVLDIADKFAELYSEKEVSVIIDNSPGYVGFNKALHLVMAKMGPKRAKFMIVSSFDEQDLMSCMSASMNIQSMVEDRISVAYYFEQLKRDGEINSEIEVKMKEKPELKRFFYSLVEEEYPQIDEDKVNANNYLSLVLNKVPDEVGPEGFRYVFENVTKETNRELFNEIARLKTDGEPGNRIYYDRNIALQFYSNLITPRKSDSDYNWPSRFTRISKRNKEELALIDDAVDRISKVQFSYLSLLNNMKQKGYERFANYLPEEWQPSYALERFSDMVATLGTFDYLLDPIVKDAMSKDSAMEIIQNVIHDMTARCNWEAYEATIISIIKKVAIRVGYNNERIPKSTRMAALLLMVIAYSETARASYASGNDFRSFLTNGTITTRKRIEWSNLLGDRISLSDTIEINTEAIREVYDSHYASFSRLFCKALLRTLDLNSDFQFLINTFELFIPYRDVMYMSKEIKDYVTSVVVEKNKDRDEKLLTELRLQMTNMKALDTVVKPVINLYLK